MTALREAFRDGGVVVAATVGAGVFSLPYAVKEAGWALGLAYLLLLSILIIVCHVFYYGALRKTGGSHRLVGLVRAHLGTVAYCVSFIAIVIGLLFALVAYLILGGTFFTIILPALDWSVAVALFWFFSSWPLFLSERRMLGVEAIGGIFLLLLIALVFLKAEAPLKFFSYSAADFSNFLVPFGPMLFALAGWTAIEPIFDVSKKEGGRGEKGIPFKGIAVGTLVSAALYVLFVAGVFGSPAEIVPDTISGLAAWPRWGQVTLALLGLFAIWTSYIPVAFEVLKSIERDCRFKHFPSMLVVLLGPLLLVFSGMDNFFAAVTLAGGVFLSLQYLFIVLVSKKILRVAGTTKLALNLIAAVFLFVAIYEVISFF